MIAEVSLIARKVLSCGPEKQKRESQERGLQTLCRDRVQKTGPRNREIAPEVTVTRRERAAPSRGGDSRERALGLLMPQLESRALAGRPQGGQRKAKKGKVRVRGARYRKEHPPGSGPPPLAGGAGVRRWLRSGRKEASREAKGNGCSLRAAESKHPP